MKDKISPQKQGRDNQRRGKKFEQYVCRQPVKLGLSIRLRQIDRTKRRFLSIGDVEFVGCFHFKLDCKFTTEHFEWVDYERFMRSTESKYCQEKGDVPIVIVGEWKGYGKIVKKNVRVAYKSVYGISITTLDKWLVRMNKEHG